MRFASALSCFALVALLAGPSPALAQSAPAPNEAAVREAVKQLIDSWNRHDVHDFAKLLTQDVEYGIPGREKHLLGRDAVAAYLPYYVQSHDRTAEVLRVKVSGNGVATALMLVGLMQLPMRDGKYAMVYAPTHAVARWRYSEGQLLMFYWNTVRTEVEAIVKAEGLDATK